MLYSPQNGVQRLSASSVTTYLQGARQASLTSAIGRGIRKTVGGIERLGTRRREDAANVDTRNDRQSAFQRSPKPRTAISRPSESAYQPRRTYDRRIEVNPSSSSSPRTRFDIERLDRAGGKNDARVRREQSKRPVKDVIVTEAPLGVPYTTAGSEFVYGTFAVTAALQAKRRRLYKVYIWRGDRDGDDKYDHTIQNLAKSKNVPVTYVAGDWDKMLSKMSGQRPNNGYVLEASPVPKLPVTSLLPVKDPAENLTVQVGLQTLEDQVINKAFNVTTTEATIPRTETKRYPLLLWLDRITDTGNIGAIVRTAYFFGVDAILIPEHGTAPLNPVTIKASAGAAEQVPILTVKREVDFVKASQSNGWRFFAAVAPESASTRKQQAPSDTPVNESQALDQAPSVLMVGNEGEGLRSFMQQAADSSVSIRGMRASASGIDSLNVSVATALLVARFMTPVAVTDLTAAVEPMKSEKAAPKPPRDSLF